MLSIKSDWEIAHQCQSHHAHFVIDQCVIFIFDHFLRRFQVLKMTKRSIGQKEIVERDQGNGDGHPCFQYTEIYWEQCEKQFQPLKPQPHSIHEETNNESLEEMQGKTECKELASQESVAEPITSSSPKESKLKEFLKDLFGWR